MLQNALIGCAQIDTHTYRSIPPDSLSLLNVFSSKGGGRPLFHVAVGQQPSQLTSLLVSLPLS